ncbi:MAG TPA: ABC-F family ATP-binding cassette domain-containing protein [Cytophagaceae bacterium]|jgi:ATP-binding cassette subfamily F protein uup|nr:ABC-F family ATP-binding cassette domain-containing protein [Cytophagaceae bacterium]
MNYLSAEGISKSYNEKWLFQNINIGISRGQKVALVGVNGTGKSTLLKILAGKIPSDGGQVAVSKDITVGYLDQDPEFVPGQKVSEALFNPNSEVVKAIHAYEAALENPENETAFQKAMERMEALNAWDYDQRVKQIVSYMGIQNQEQNVDTLSGGQKKRVAMARVLIDLPDLLIMDEPTNHLDLDTIEWLEGFLSTQNTTILMVTHDRYFLDKVCNEIVELDRGEVFKYKGTYSYFLERKAEREQQHQASTDKARNLMKKELEWMRRQPKARGTKAKYRIDAFDDLKEKAAGKEEVKKLELNIKQTRQGNKVIEVEHISKNFGDKKIVDDFSYIFKKKDRIGIVGKNGMGKSTLLNMLTGQLAPDKGKIDKGETTLFGYFSQQGLVLKEDMRVIEVVKEIAEYITLGDGTTMGVSKFLEYFLFPPALQYTPVSKLSGGERKRLHLMRILIKNPNFLILDEPTNDFDLATLNVLEDFLMNFGGCLIIVSHDRYFMDRLVEQLFVFEGNGYVRIFNGNYTDYREEQEEEAKTGNARPSVTNTTFQEEKKESPKTEQVSSSKKLSFKEKKEYEELEKDIQQMEQKKAVLVEKLNSGKGSYQELAEWSAEIEKLNHASEEKSMRWLELSEKI